MINKIIKFFKSFLIIKKIKKHKIIKLITNPLSIPQSNVLILKKPIMKIIVLLIFYFQKKMKIISVENIIGISLATNYQHLKYCNQ